jgi:hypothetical protein
MLNVICTEYHIQALYAEYHCAECRYAECRYAECHGAKKRKLRVQKKF